MGPPSFGTVGRRIRSLRRVRSMTQVAFADLMGVSQPTICGWEKGARLDHIKLAAIADALGSSLAELLAPEVVDAGDESARTAMAANG